MGIKSSYNRATYFAKAAESRPGWIKDGEPYPNQFGTWYGNKGTIAGGNDPSQSNVIQYTLISGGNVTDAVDFGDLTAASGQNGGNGGNCGNPKSGR